MKARKLSRRDFLAMSAAAAAGAVLASCQPAEPVVEEVVVRETVVVEGEAVEVTKIVEVPVEQTVEVPAEAEGIVIRVHQRVGGECDNWGYFAQQFNDEHFPNIHVKMECFPGPDYFAKLNTMIAGGTIGDVVWISSIEGFYRMAATGVWATLDDLVAQTGFDLGEFYEQNVEAAKLHGKLYGLPQLAHPGRTGLYYHKTLFDAAGVDYPDDTWTYDDLVAAAQKLTNPGEGVWGFMDTERSYFSVLVYLRAWGGDVINEDGTQCPINSPESVAALQYISDLYHEHEVVPLPGVTTLGPWEMFAANKLAMYQQGFWGIYCRDYLEAPDILGVAPMPIGPAGVRGSMFESDPVCITAISEHKEEAFEYITSMTTYEGQIHFCHALGAPSPRPDVMNSEEVQADPNMKVYAAIMAEAMPLVLAANFRETEYFKFIGEGLEAVWLGEAALEEVIDDIQMGAQAILDKPSLEA
jgi:ABC-type glycerol-3-phosphate transport system substrate-binding protein